MRWDRDTHAGTLQCVRDQCELCGRAKWGARRITANDPNDLFAACAQETFGGKPVYALQIGMSPKHLPQFRSSAGNALGMAAVNEAPPFKLKAENGDDKPYLLSVRKTAEYLGRSEKAVRHLYERRILTPLRIDGRVFIDRREIDHKYDQARSQAY